LALPRVGPTGPIHETFVPVKLNVAEALRAFAYLTCPPMYRLDDALDQVP
jgi:hypothetical protein